MRGRFLLPLRAFAAYHSLVFRRRTLFFPGLLALGTLGISSPSWAEEKPAIERIVVNRIVAVVDQEVVTLVELKRRAGPFQKQLAETPADKRPAVEAQLNKDLLQQAIDERLIARAARALRISVTTEEIERALDTIAQGQKITREKLLQAAAEQGFAEAQYREQLVRQLLVAKLLRVKMAEQLKKLDKASDTFNKQYEKIEKDYLQSLRANVFIEVRL